MADEADHSMMFFATCDLAAIVRGRSVTADHRAHAMESGLGWVPADLALTCFGSIGENVFGAAGDLRLLPDPQARFIFGGHGEAPDTTVFLANQVELDGRPWNACPRTVLQRTCEELHSQTGLRLVVSFEHEFSLLGAPPTHPFSLSRLLSAEPFGSNLVQALRVNGMDPETWLPEYGDGQFEITIAPASAVQAADRAIALRELVREVSRQDGYDVTFTPIVHPSSVGNGVHIHFTLVDSEGRSMMPSGEGSTTLSETARKFSAGVIRHAQGLTALTAASRISYLRLTPHRWSASGAFLADRNREALLRICPTHTLGGGDPGKQLHLEFRAADATANPWLALAGIIRAGMEGIIQDVDPAQVWPESVQESELTEVPPLPSSLESALESLERDSVLSSWLGQPLLGTYLGVKRAELAELSALDDIDACERLSHVY